MNFYFQNTGTEWKPVFEQGKPEYLTLAAGAKLDLTFKFKSQTGANVSAPETSWVLGFGDDFGNPNHLLFRMTASRAQDGSIAFTGSFLTKKIIGRLSSKKQITTWAELAGISGNDTSPGTVIRWKVVLENRITREGMQNPPALTDGFLTDAQIRSLINTGTASSMSQGWSVSVLNSAAIPEAGKVYTRTVQANDTFTFFTPETGKDGRFYLYLTQPSSYVNFTLPDVIWEDGITPDFNQNGKMFQLYFHYVNGGWHGQSIPDMSRYMISPSSGTAGQVLKKTVSGTEWGDGPSLTGYATEAWVTQQGYLTEHQSLAGYQTLITESNKLSYSLISGTPSLATVATSGSYNDLTNKPTIPSLTGYATEAWVTQQGYLTEHQSLAGYQTLITESNKLSYSLISGTPTIPTALADLTSDSTHRLVTDAQITTWNGKITEPSSGTAGQVLKKTASGTEWATVTDWSGMSVEALSGTAIADAGKIYTKTLASGDIFTFPTVVTGKCAYFRLWLSMPSTAVSFTLPSNIQWVEGQPDFTTGNALYMLVFEWNSVLNKWRGNLEENPVTLEA